jgi:uncharacterized protein YjdB
MHKSQQRIRGGLGLSALMALTVVACSDGPLGVPPMVVERVDVAPDGRTLVVGDSMRLSALPRTADGTINGSVGVTWHSDAESVATVRADGMLVAWAAGTARIEARAGGRAGSVMVTVVAAELLPAHIEIPPSVTLRVGQQLAVEAVVRAADGTVLGAWPVTWSSTNGPVATVAANWGTFSAMLHAHSVGTTTVRAQTAGLQAETTVHVVAALPDIAWVVLGPAQRGVWVSQLASYAETVYLLGDNGQRLDGAPITWSVQNADIASIDQFGRVQGLRAGVTRVTAAAGDASASVELTVFARQPAGVESYEITYDWWDGAAHLMPHVGDTTWTSAGGTRTVPFYLYGGALKLDRSAQPYTYERVLVAEAWVEIDGVLTRIGERHTTDRGTFVNLYAYGTDAQGIRLTSTTTPGLEYDLTERAAGELTMPVVNHDGRTMQVLFRMRP